MDAAPKKSMKEFLEELGRQRRVMSPKESALLVECFEQSVAGFLVALSHVRATTVAHLRLDETKGHHALQLQLRTIANLTAEMEEEISRLSLVVGLQVEELIDLPSSQWSQFGEWKERES
jgi:hypothetical protein